MRTSERLLLGVAFGLGALLALQILRRPPVHTGRVLAASWAEQPRSLEETAASAEQVVLGRVTRVRRARDIVVPLPGLPGGTDSIPIEVVTIRLEKSLKGPARGGPPETIEVVHTGISKGRDQVTLVEDPAYAAGEQYVLFVKPGPEVHVEGSSMRVHRRRARTRCSSPARTGSRPGSGDGAWQNSRPMSSGAFSGAAPRADRRHPRASSARLSSR